MPRYLLSRLLQSIVLVVVVSIVMFALISSAPGGPAILVQQDVTAEAAATMRRNLGLDDPVVVRYGRWASRMLQGDAGVSLSNSRPVGLLLAQRFSATALLASAALLLAIVVAIPIGVMSAVRRNRWFDRIATAAAFVGVSVPNFWLGIMMIILFSVTLGWLPSGGMGGSGVVSWWDRLRHLAMPAFVLSAASMAQLTRYTRSSMIGVLREDYVRTARAKGVPQTQVLTRHVLRNGLIPVITVIGVIMPRLFSGAAITESIFAWPGLGRLAVDAALQRDFPVIMALTMLVSVLVISASLVVDLLYSVIDPRIRYD
jgi:peptide/nickel transport system permease protein